MFVKGCTPWIEVKYDVYSRFKEALGFFFPFFSFKYVISYYIISTSSTTSHLHVHNSLVSFSYILHISYTVHCIDFKKISKSLDLDPSSFKKSLLMLTLQQDRGKVICNFEESFEVK